MDIRPDPPPALDPLGRQRQSERAARAERTAAGSGGEAGRAGSRVDLAGVDVDRFVAELATHDPVDLHRVEDLRERIANGDYRADPEELADGLLEALNQERGTI